MPLTSSASPSPGFQSLARVSAAVLAVRMSAMS
jgi:hypothetical protein